MSIDLAPFCGEDPLSNDERKRQWERRRAAFEHSRSQAGSDACRLSGTGEHEPRPPARGPDVAGNPTAHEHPVVPCALPSPQTAQSSNSPEPPPPESMQADTSFAAAGVRLRADGWVRR